MFNGGSLILISQTMRLLQSEQRGKPQAASADIAVIPCFVLARRKLPYGQGHAGDGDWADTCLAGYRQADSQS
jgi:hypothetical protein